MVMEEATPMTPPNVNSIQYDMILDDQTRGGICFVNLAFAKG